ncbi:MAG TPA: hypothetical protein CFH84_08630 [Sulfurimonas sp. UBA12504]|nr:MAG: hypothetical protein A2019_09385 [Sulfurimonas sp. GWF2_37_8]DAB29669.1 MAG TPA: hypothetical protein CFH84_08630 [Sulfurimonas sp. UBA12504]
MKVLFFLYLCVTLLIADNPKIYSTLGDAIYNNTENILKLKDMEAYAAMYEDIDKYISEVHVVKKIGKAIEEGDTSVSSKEYLEKLRILSKENDNYVRSAQSKFRTSMSDEDSELFSLLINSELVDTSRYKNEIINYYVAHSESVNADGVIQKFIDEENSLKNKEVVNKKLYKSKQQYQKEKIQRIREQDEAQQKALEETLEEELEKKKSEIRENQVKELAR